MSCVIVYKYLGHRETLEGHGRTQYQRHNQRSKATRDLRLVNMVDIKTGSEFTETAGNPIVNYDPP